MKTLAGKTAFQVALRNCSKDRRGVVNIYVILVKEDTCNQAHISAEDCCWSQEGCC